MYHVSAQGVDERMINVHCYYYYYLGRSFRLDDHFYLCCNSFNNNNNNKGFIFSVVTVFVITAPYCLVRRVFKSSLFIMLNEWGTCKQITTNHVYAQMVTERFTHLMKHSFAGRGGNTENRVVFVILKIQVKMQVIKHQMQAVLQKDP